MMRFFFGDKDEEYQGNADVFELEKNGGIVRERERERR